MDNSSSPDNSSSFPIISFNNNFHPLTDFSDLITSLDNMGHSSPPNEVDNHALLGLRRSSLPSPPSLPSSFFSEYSMSMSKREKNAIAVKKSRLKAKIMREEKDQEIDKLKKELRMYKDKMEIIRLAANTFVAIVTSTVNEANKLGARMNLEDTNQYQNCYNGYQEEDQYSTSPSA